MNLPDFIDDGTTVSFVKHFYRTTYAHPDDPFVPRRHACLHFGIWCWRNVFEHPGDVYRYAKKMLYNKLKV